jgi:hypothetical protein
LRLVEATLLAVPFASAPALAVDQSALSKQIDDLSKALTADAAKDDGAQTALTSLLAKIATADCAVDPSKKSDCKIGQLNAFATQTKATYGQYKTDLTVDQQKNLATALQPWLSLSVPNKDAHLLSALDFAASLSKSASVKEPDAVVTSLSGAISNTVTSVIATLPSALPKSKSDAMAQPLQADQSALYQLVTALSADKRINILGAWYGDMRDIRAAQTEPFHPWEYNARFCSATRAVRARCEGMATCYQSATGTQGGAAPAQGSTGSSSELGGTSLCGYEPAPFADPQNKGVIVKYECVALDPPTWTRLRGSEPARQTTNGKPLDAVLRTNTIEEIRCQ